ncbi:transmembrane protease serine 6-like [Pollicipes pollicipes]|uniref:transmembrane protease serine 6-like n=1 Tax=Pollicipes pollicipes TaxID=41117 RepID=UPI001885252A|nr:transmembrane protease serine 6-like [Pollicipes pollicipes]
MGRIACLALCAALAGAVPGPQAGESHSQQPTQASSAGGGAVSAQATLVQCGLGSSCVEASACSVSSSSSEACVTTESFVGVCCPLESAPGEGVAPPGSLISVEPPPPPPPPPRMVVCSEKEDCVPPRRCDADRYINRRQWKAPDVDYLDQHGPCEIRAGREGVCCRLPPEPREVQCQPDEQRCVRNNFCDEKGFISDYSVKPSPVPVIDGFKDFCKMKYGRKGICCKIPPIIRTEILCNFNEKCVGPGVCDEKGFIQNVTDETAIFGLPAEYRLGELPPEELGPFDTFCQLPRGGTGRCCRLPDPEWPRRLKLPTCGHSFHIRMPGDNTRHARETVFGEIPWQATIFEKETDKFVCGGTIVSNRQIITSDHCVETYNTSQLYVRVGEFILFQESEPLAHQDIDVRSVKTHPERGALFNDIAVIELERHLKFTPHIQPICLPKYNQKFTGRCVVSGWAKPAFIGRYQERMEKLELPTVETPACESSLWETHLGHFFRLGESMLCAGGEKDADACRGDAGGALACPSADGTYVMAGVAAWSVGCAEQGVPSVYTSVTRTLRFTRRYVRGSKQHPFFREVPKEEPKVEESPELPASSEPEMPASSAPELPASSAPELRR